MIYSQHVRNKHRAVIETLTFLDKGPIKVWLRKYRFLVMRILIQSTCPPLLISVAKLFLLGHHSFHSGVNPFAFERLPLYTIWATKTKPGGILRGLLKMHTYAYKSTHHLNHSRGFLGVLPLLGLVQAKTPTWSLVGKLLIAVSMAAPERRQHPVKPEQSWYHRTWTETNPEDRRYNPGQKQTITSAATDPPPINQLEPTNQKPRAPWLPPVFNEYEREHRKASTRSHPKIPPKASA